MPIPSEPAKNSTSAISTKTVHITHVSASDDHGDFEGISLVDGSFPRQCGIPQCGVRKLTVEEAVQWRFFGPPDVPPESK